MGGWCLASLRGSSSECQGLWVPGNKVTYHGVAVTELLLVVAMKEGPVVPGISFLKEKPEIWTLL